MFLRGRRLNCRSWPGGIARRFGFYCTFQYPHTVPGMRAKMDGKHLVQTWWRTLQRVVLNAF